MFTKTYNKLSFEDIQFALQNRGQFILINTLPSNEQSCLITNTLPHIEEEHIINDLITTYDFATKKIIVYGRNINDELIITKYNQLTGLGFQTVYLYTGGLFEWLLLQDIYGKEAFPTTTRLLDILKHKPQRTFGGNLLM
jgi:hypothetical protein|tara:strand:+ start:187 stop:606 length:420 start_codon:yes stop_codon:yes gene_type:complete